MSCPPNADNSNPPRPADGFILGVFHLRDVVKRHWNLLQPTGVDIYIFDVSAPEKSKLIFSHPSRNPRHVPCLSCKRRRLNHPPLFTSKRTFPWPTGPGLSIAFLPTFISTENQDGNRLAALLASLLITGLVVGYLFLLTGRTARIEKLVAQRTRELQASEKRFRLLGGKCRRRLLSARRKRTHSRR